jgi:hypothetical protein
MDNTTLIRLAAGVCAAIVLIILIARRKKQTD